MNGQNENPLIQKNKSVSIEIVDNGFIVRIHNPKSNMMEEFAKTLMSGMMKGVEQVEEPWKNIPMESEREKELLTFVCKDIEEALSISQDFLIAKSNV